MGIFLDNFRKNMALWPGKFLVATPSRLTPKHVGVIRAANHALLGAAGGIHVQLANIISKNNYFIKSQSFLELFSKKILLNGTSTQKIYRCDALQAIGEARRSAQGCYCGTSRGGRKVFNMYE